MIVEILVNGKIELVDSKWEPRHAQAVQTTSKEASASGEDFGRKGPDNSEGYRQERPDAQASSR